MLRPLEDKIVVKQIKQEEKVSSSGLLMPGFNDEKPNEGIVVAVGPGIKLDNGVTMVPDVSVGDHVVFSKYQGTEVQDRGETFLILAYRDIVAIIGENTND